MRQHSRPPPLGPDLAAAPGRQRWLLLGSAAGLTGLVATLVTDLHVDGGASDATPAVVDQLSQGKAHVSVVVGYVTVALLLVLAAAWRRHVEPRVLSSTAARVVPLALTSAAGASTLGYGWKGAMAVYLPGGVGRRHVRSRGPVHLLPAQRLRLVHRLARCHGGGRCGGLDGAARAARVAVDRRHQRAAGARRRRHDGRDGDCPASPASSRPCGWSSPSPAWPSGGARSPAEIPTKGSPGPRRRSRGFLSRGGAPIPAQRWRSVRSGRRRKSWSPVGAAGSRRR